MAARHELVKLTLPEAHCRCGWAARLDRPESWGTVAARDELLDRYNRHRGRGPKLRPPLNPPSGRPPRFG